MSIQTGAQLIVAVIIAFNLIGALALLYLRRPLYVPSRWWIGHVSNIISVLTTTALLAIGGFWS